MFEDLIEFLSSEEIRDVLSFIGTAIVAIALGLWAVFKHLYSNKKNKPSQDSSNTNINASSGAVVINDSQNITVYKHDRSISKALNKLSEDWQKANEREDQFQQKIQEYQDQITALKDALVATVTLTREAKIEHGNERIKEALAASEQGDTKLAVKILKEIEEISKSQGEEALKSAADAARHQGVLAFNNNPKKALAAYHRAIEIDPNNPDSWNRVGHLFYSFGELDEAENAFKKTEQLGENVNDRMVVAVALTNLARVYIDYEEYDQARINLKKSLEIYKESDNRQDIANGYFNLGLLYQIIDEFENSEFMFLQSIRLNKELNNKKELFINYYKLGLNSLKRKKLDIASYYLRDALKHSNSFIDPEMAKKAIAILLQELAMEYIIKGDESKYKELHLAVAHIAMEVADEYGAKSGSSLLNSVKEVKNLYE